MTVKGVKMLVDTSVLGILSDVDIKGVPPEESLPGRFLLKWESELEKGNIFYLDPIAYFEIRRGISKWTRQSRNPRHFPITERMERIMVCLDYTPNDILVISDLWSELEQRGKQIPMNDLFIGGHAKSRNFDLLTADKRHMPETGAKIMLLEEWLNVESNP